MKLNKSFALRVREILKEKKMMQYKLAQETGLYHSTMTDSQLQVSNSEFKKYGTYYQGIGIINDRILW